MKVNISDIKVNSGRREVSPEPVAELSKSIAAAGLLNPLTLTGDYTLVAGLHRLEAVKLLGWTEIECTVVDMNGLQAELAEIDENIVRTSLSKQELGEQFAPKGTVRNATPGDKSGGGTGSGDEARRRQQRQCQIGIHDKILRRGHCRENRHEQADHQPASSNRQ